MFIIQVAPFEGNTKYILSYGIRGNGDFLVSDPATGQAQYVPHNKVQIVRPFLTGEQSGFFAAFLQELAELNHENDGVPE